MPIEWWWPVMPRFLCSLQSIRDSTLHSRTVQYHLLSSTSSIASGKPLGSSKHHLKRIDGDQVLMTEEFAILIMGQSYAQLLPSYATCCRAIRTTSPNSRSFIEGLSVTLSLKQNLPMKHLHLISCPEHLETLATWASSQSATKVQVNKKEWKPQERPTRPIIGYHIQKHAQVWVWWRRCLFIRKN